MPIYTTEYVKNLSTGEPFTFEVTDRQFEWFERQKKLAMLGQSNMKALQQLRETFEFSLFPAYKELLKIWFENGFTTELITQILSDFGVDESFIDKLLEDEGYISEISPRFEAITHDGERAARTMGIVYRQTMSYFSLSPPPRNSFKP